MTASLCLGSALFSSFNKFRKSGNGGRYGPRFSPGRQFQNTSPDLFVFAVNPRHPFAISIANAESAICLCHLPGWRKSVADRSWALRSAHGTKTERIPQRVKLDSLVDIMPGKGFHIATPAFNFPNSAGVVSGSPRTCGPCHEAGRVFT